MDRATHCLQCGGELSLADPSRSFCSASCFRAHKKKGLERCDDDVLDVSCRVWSKGTRDKLAVHAGGKTFWDHSTDTGAIIGKGVFFYASREALRRDIRATTLGFDCGPTRAELSTIGRLAGLNDFICAAESGKLEEGIT